VLAHGLSAVRDQSLDRYAERFAEAGLTAIVFEYRHFGDSGGAPRQLLDIDRQLDDWRAAIAYARTLDGVEPTRVAIWGTSLSGGHVITLAADDPSVAAVVSQVAFADGLVTVPSLGLGQSLWLMREGLRDQIGALLRRPPHTIAVIGPAGSRRVLNSSTRSLVFGLSRPRIGVAQRDRGALRIANRHVPPGPPGGKDPLPDPVLRRRR
jgi:fermentation-respiration switch protein FrsA (DUF1100 family)